MSKKTKNFWIVSMSKKTKNFWITVGASVIIYAILAFIVQFGFFNMYQAGVLNLIGINIILVVSLNLINGITGQFSIGHAGFMSVGAYMAATATMRFDMPFIIALIIGGIIASLAGLIVGIPTLRLKGDYLAIATLGFGEIIRIFFLTNDYFGGASGISGIPKITNWHWIFFIALLTVIVIRNFSYSTHGRACIAIRDNEIAAETMGVDTTKYKVIAFLIGSFFAGLAGGLYAHNFYIIQPNVFNFLLSFNILVMVVLGGLGSITGSIIGAVVLTIISQALSSFPEVRMIIYSLILILLMVFRPQGLLGTKEFSLEGTKNLFRRKRGEKSNVYSSEG